MIGIAIGLVVGVVAVILFVFLGGTEGLDDPSLEVPAPMERPQQAPGPARGADG